MIVGDIYVYFDGNWRYLCIFLMIFYGFKYFYKILMIAVDVDDFLSSDRCLPGVQNQFFDLFSIKIGHGSARGRIPHRK